MKDEAQFRQFLKKSGKKEHVIDGLVKEVLAFETYLAEVGLAGLENAGEKEIQNYIGTLDSSMVKERMRGLALYFKFAGRDSLARLANDIREQGIAKHRKPFKLGEFRGVNPQEIARLEAFGIVTVDQMLDAGRTPNDRQWLAERTQIALETILELVKLSDLSRMGALKSVRARLYYEAGLDTPDKFTQWEPDALRRYLVEWVARTGFNGIVPLPKEIRNAISTARKLQKIVE